ncbi:MAG: hypothetical protein LC737_02985, partial [Chloroflexi bacterium]|nr:hypothetical protein [Chloroflexota bacterium]
MQLGLATSDGLVLVERDGAAWHSIRRSLPGRELTSIIAREGVILVGTHDGVLRSDDGGEAWQDASVGLSTRYVRWLAYHPQISDLEFVGTEPAGIFVSHDGAQSWRECAEVARLRDEHEWFLPYSDGAGCVRGFAFHGRRAYAAVEVGGALRSDNGGETWQLAEGSDGNPDLDGPAEPLIYPDVHSIHVHPSSPDLVFAPTGGGFYRSSDGGCTWTLLYDCYVRAVWLDPSDARHLILGPAEGVDSNGRIEETRDGGATWHVASSGLRVPWAHHMVERFAPIGDELFALLSNGEVLRAPLATLAWQRVFAEV